MKITNVGKTVLLVGVCLTPALMIAAQGQRAQGRGPGEAAAPLMTTHDQDQMYAAWRDRVSSVDKPPAPTDGDQRIIQQIMTFRERLANAIRTKDADKLNSYFADDYIITLGNALVDDKTGRIRWLLAGRPPFEVQPIDTAQFRVLDNDNVVMTANQRYTMGGNNGTPIQYGVLRSLFIFTKDRRSPNYDGWRLLASQSLRAPVTPPRAPRSRSAPRLIGR